jgi:dimethylargininase
MTLVALTREVPDSIARCELTHLERTPIDLGRARAQHEAYEHELRALGCTLVRVAPAMDYPDSVFVEDAAVVLDEVAVVTRPGAESRRGETRGVAAALAPYRPIVVLEDPATLDGGDVLRVGRRLFVGVGGRSNPDGVEQLRGAVAGHGYEVTAVTARDCLHLKSAATAVSETSVLLNPRWVEPAVFSACERIEVDPGEPAGGNVLRLHGVLLCAAAAPRTRARLERLGFAVRAVDVSELAKAEAGVTCCSIILKTGP